MHNTPAQNTEQCNNYRIYLNIMNTGTKTEKCQKEWTGAKHVKVNAEKEGRWIQGEVSF